MYNFKESLHFVQIINFVQGLLHSATGVKAISQYHQRALSTSESTHQFLYINKHRVYDF